MTTEAKEALRRQMDKQGMHDNMLRAGLAAIIGGESHFVPKWETSWSRTNNSRIRRFFGSRVRDLSEAELNELKRDDRTFFNHIYGPQFNDVHTLGQEEADDGYNYRGGGLLQITGRYNYKTVGMDIGVDLLKKPNLLVDDIEVSAAAAVAYMKRHFKGGDFDMMKRAVGRSIGEPDDEKNRLFEIYMQTGEWNYTGKGSEPEAEEIDPIIAAFVESLQNAEKFLSRESEDPYEGPIDEDPGPALRRAYRAYMKRHGRKV